MAETATTPNDAASLGEPHGSEPAEDAPSIEDLQAKIDDLTKHSRKWEERAKENKKAFDALSAQRQESMTDDEKRTEALTAAEKRAVEAEERATKAEQAVLRYRIAAAHGMSDEDADLILTASDAETMTKQAERFSAKHTGPRPNPAQGKRGAGAPSTKDVLMDFFDSNF